MEPLCSTIFISQSDTYHYAFELEKIYNTLTFNKLVHYRFSKKTLRYKDFSEIKMIELRNALWLASCMYIYSANFIDSVLIWQSKFGMWIFWKIDKNARSSFAVENRLSTRCTVKLSIRIYYLTPSTLF